MNNSTIKIRFITLICGVSLWMCCALQCQAQSDPVRDKMCDDINKAGLDWHVGPSPGRVIITPPKGPTEKPTDSSPGYIVVQEGENNNLRAEEEVRSPEYDHTKDRQTVGNPTEKPKESNLNRVEGNCSKKIPVSEYEKLACEYIETQYDLETKYKNLCRKYNSIDNDKEDFFDFLDSLNKYTSILQKTNCADQISSNDLNIAANMYIRDYISDNISQYRESKEYVRYSAYQAFTHYIYDLSVCPSKYYNECNRNANYPKFCEKLRNEINDIIPHLTSLKEQYCTFVPEIDMPALSNDVYKEQNAPPGWKRINHYDYKNSGFYSALYQNIYNPNIYVLAFRGTETMANDWGNDIDQAFTKKSEQYIQAHDVITNVTQSLQQKNVKLYLTGHSLGGGLAAYAHVTAPQNTNIVATYTYNSAGIKNANLKNTSNNSSNIYAYHTIDDPLTSLQKKYNQYISVRISLGIVSSFPQVFNLSFPTKYSSKKSKQSTQYSYLEKIDKLIILGKEEIIPTYTGHSIVPIEQYYANRIIINKNSPNNPPLSVLSFRKNIDGLMKSIEETDWQ